jgi:hypothetical protein
MAICKPSNFSKIRLFGSGLSGLGYLYKQWEKS